MTKKVMIVGAGLSGLLMAYSLACNENMEIIVLEKGKRYENRDGAQGLDLVCGEGGAGTIYGGKLCFPPASSGVWLRSKMRKDQFKDFMQNVLGKFLPGVYHDYCGGYLYKKGQILTKNYPSAYISRDEMKKFVYRLLGTVKGMGVLILHDSTFLGYEAINGKFIVKFALNGRYTLMEKVDYLILASGRESSDSIRKWFTSRTKIKLQNPDLGLRFSIQDNEWGIFRQIGKDIKIKMQIGCIGVRTFCVCAGGTRTLVNLNDIQYFDGHFDDIITREVNLGVLARSPYIVGYEGAALYCQALKKYLNADMSLKDFCKYSARLIVSDTMFDDIFNSIKEFIYVLQQEGVLENNLDKYPVWLPSADRWNAIVETNQYFETGEKKLYVIGDAVGISRGFIQAMWSAYCASKDILLKTYKKIEEIV